MKQRTNDEWLDELRSSGPSQEVAINDLREYLLRAVLYFFSQNPGDLHRLAGEEIAQVGQDLAQEALLTVLRHLDDFRSESKFTTWAYRFAINAALVEARRRRWRDISLETLQAKLDVPDFQFEDEATQNPDLAARQHEIWDMIHYAIDHDLTPRQREILTEVAFNNVPMDVVTERFHTNRNAVYKLLHDARTKLKKALAERGFGVEEILDVFVEG